MSSKKAADETRHPAKKAPEIEQSILDSKAALATSPDKEKQQQAYPQALAHDTAQESVDNQTELQEKQPANAPEVVPPSTKDLAKEGTPDNSPEAKHIQDQVKTSTDTATAKKEDLVGEPPIIMQAEENVKRDAKHVKFGGAGSVKIESLGRHHHGLNGLEYDVVVRVSDDQTVTLRGIPADLLT